MSGPEDAPSRAQQGVQREAQNALSSAALNELRDIAFDRMESAGGMLRIISRASSAFFAVYGVIGDAKNILDMAMAGYAALTVERHCVRRVAAAHAYAYWVLRYGTYERARRLPPRFRADMARSDAADRDLGRRAGLPNFSSDGGLTAADYQTIWADAFGRVYQGLENNMLSLAQNGELQAAARSFPGGDAMATLRSAREQADFYRTAVLGRLFDYDPKLAANVYFYASLSDDNWQTRQLAVRLFSRIPYIAPERGTRG